MLTILCILNIEGRHRCLLLYRGYRVLTSTPWSSSSTLPSLVGLLRLVCKLILVLAGLLFGLLLLLKSGRLLASVQAPDHVCCSTSIIRAQKVLVLPQRLLREEMIGGRDLIVPVCLDAFD